MRPHCLALAAMLLLSSCHNSAGPGLPGFTLGQTSSLRLNSAPPTYWMDQIGNVKFPAPGNTVQLSGDEPVEIKGWAVDAQARTTAKGIELVLDGVPYAIPYGIDRPDVAAGANIPAYLKCGYSATLRARLLVRGNHRLRLRIIGSQGLWYYETPEWKLEVKWAQ